MAGKASAGPAGGRGISGIAGDAGARRRSGLERLEHRRDREAGCLVIAQGTEVSGDDVAQLQQSVGDNIGRKAIRRTERLLDLMHRRRQGFQSENPGFALPRMDLPTQKRQRRDAVARRKFETCGFEILQGRFLAGQKFVNEWIVDNASGLSHRTRLGLGPDHGLQQIAHPFQAGVGIRRLHEPLHHHQRLPGQFADGGRRRFGLGDFAQQFFDTQARGGVVRRKQDDFAGDLFNLR